MKSDQRYLKESIDQLVTQLLRSYAEVNYQAADQDAVSPFSTMRLWARIRREQQAQQFWGAGVIAAKKWLFGLSVITLLFIFSNLVIVGLQLSFSTRQQSQSSGLLLADEGDYVVEEVVIGAKE